MTQLGQFPGVFAALGDPATFRRDAQKHTIESTVATPGRYTRAALGKDADAAHTRGLELPFDNAVALALQEALARPAP